MLQKITLENFKIHEKTEIEFKPITIFIGPNNCGKSSILQSLTLLKQSKRFSQQSPQNQYLIPYEKSDEWKNQCIINIGKFKDILRKGKDSITIEVEGKIKSHIAKRYTGSEDIVIHSTMKFVNNILKYNYGIIKSEAHHVEWDTNKVIRNGKLTLPDYPKGNVATQVRADIYSPVFPTGLQGAKQAEIDYDGLMDYSEDFFQSIPKFYDSFHLVYALRGMENDHINLDPNEYDHIEFIDLKDRSNAIFSTVAYNDELENNLSKWFKQLFGVESRSRMKPQQKVGIEIQHKNKVKSPIVNEGMGLNQLAYLLSPIALANENDCIFIEEPEAHLYPKLQTMLTKLFLQINKEENKQFVISTHSEHILFGFLTAIATKELSLNDLIIYSFEKEDSKAVVNQVLINEDGSVKGGIPGFFDNSVEQLIKYIQAISS